jgi:CCR4-NOT transcription complex subunit 1
MYFIEIILIYFSFLQPSLTQNANIQTLINDPSYSLVRIKQPPEHINDKISFTFNNLSFSNLNQKAQELKDVLANDEQLWKWVGQYLVIKRVSLEHNFHSLYAGFLNTLNINILFDTVLNETHRNIKVRKKNEIKSFEIFSSS